MTDDLDDGIRDIVLLLREAGYKTFTSCEGGKGHPFPEPTVGLRFKGDYFESRDRLAKFLRSHGRRFFEITLVSAYDRKRPRGRHYVYLIGFDIASPEKRKKLVRLFRQRTRRMTQRLEAAGMGEWLREWEAKHRRR